MTSRRYSRREERWNWGIHLLGAVLVLVAGFWLLRPADFSGKWLFPARIFYWCAMFGMCVASSLYHLVRDAECKALCRKFDHCAIYILIVGTYAPLMAGVLPNWRGGAVMAVLGVLSAAGIVMKFRFSGRFHRWEVVIYLLMGWLCLLVLKPLWEGMDRTGFRLLAAGGAAYTAGVIFYAVKREFFHAAWHVMVLTGMVLQLLAVLTVR